MYTAEKLLQMLTNRKASVRYEACEWLRVRQESSPEIVRALELATHDQDKEVAERAVKALQADVHHQMAIELGMIKPDGTESNYKKPAPYLSMGKTQLVEIFSGIMGVVLILAGPIIFVNSGFQWSSLVCIAIGLFLLLSVHNRWID